MARALYTPSPSAEECAVFGFTVEEAAGPTTEVWPDNVLSVNCFVAMSTQWRVGVAGATGLDYNALPVVMRLIGVPVKERAVVFEEIRELEDAALIKMREKS